MSEPMSAGAAGQRPGVSGGGVRRAGSAEVTAGRLEAWEAEPPAWPGEARARKPRPVPRRAGVWCCVCGAVRAVRPGLVEDDTHLVCGPCGTSGKQPEVPGRPGMIVVRTVNVAGYCDGYVDRVAAAGERASVDRAAGLARAAVLDAPAEPGS